ncbi:MAG: hypothetical protein IK115_14015 [Lachnospiraceae bacterium]|nr:hypothetical protein [Lachnospiraceae bacterium]
MINNEHKDRLFKMIFGRPEHREWTLSLYNAINGTAYEDASKIEFNTMEDVLFMGMKNDTSFLLDSYLNIWEHQSTPAPNAPLRCLMYLGRLWAKKYGGRRSLYSRNLISLPLPRCVVFYNGTENEAEERTLCLSEAFPKNKPGAADVELKVHLLNVNSGHNRKLMAACRPMYEYSWLIGQIRTNAKTMNVEEAVLKAIGDMPEDFLIRDFVLENKEEVQMSILTEYDHEAEMRLIAEEEREEGRKEGRDEGREELNALNRWLIEYGRIEDMCRAAEDPAFQQELLEEMRNAKA